MTNRFISIDESRRALEYIRSMSQQYQDFSNDSLMKLIASDIRTPVTVLKTISENTSNVELLRRIATNPNTSEEVLNRLAKHGNKEVRLALATNPNTANIAVTPLSFDDSPTVRFTLAENPYTNTVVLETLRDDEDPVIAYQAQETLTRTQPAV